jgi:hypothetical protein
LATIRISGVAFLVLAAAAGLIGKGMEGKRAVGGNGTTGCRGDGVFGGS